MKVLFCLPGNEWGGPDREPVRTLERALTATGRVDVSFIQFSRDAKEIIRDKNRTLIPCRSSLSRSMFDGFRTERRAMADEIRRQKPDLLHVHWTQLGHALAAMDSGIPYVVTVHDAALACAYWNWSWSPGPAICALGGLVITRAVLRNAPHIIAVSPYVGEHVQRYFLPGKKLRPCPASVLDSRHSTLAFPSSISVIPNPVSLPDFSGFKSQVSKVTPVFAAVGHWGPLKNFDLALRAFSHVRRALPSAGLVLIGKDLGKNTPCHAWAARNGLDSGVHFLGPLHHMELLLFLQTHADCLVHPSRTEGFGLGVAEAMDARIPVIVSDAGALPWLLEDGRCGVLVRERSSRAWTEAMLAAGKAVSARKLETSHGEGGADGWTSVAELARLRIASLCDPHGIAERHLEIYTKTLHR